MVRAFWLGLLIMMLLHGLATVAGCLPVRDAV
jgi:hypothetical protein